MTTSKIFLPLKPKAQNDLLPWAIKVTHVLDELNLRSEKAVQETLGAGIECIDLDLLDMVKATPGTSGTLALMPVSDGGTLGFYKGQGGQGWSTLAWLATDAVLPGNTGASRWHINVRLPGNYKAKTDLTLYLCGVCVETDNGHHASAHTIALSAYRNRTTAANNTEGFGISPALDGSNWTWNDDLCLTNIQTVPFKNSGTSQFTQLSFTIDSHNVNYPLFAGCLLQLQFTSSITAVAVAAYQYFTNFYITYPRTVLL